MYGFNNFDFIYQGFLLEYIKKNNSPYFWTKDRSGKITDKVEADNRIKEIIDRTIFSKHILIYRN